MPNTDPLYVVVLAAAWAWLLENWPVIYGLVLATSITWMRNTYRGERSRQRLYETVLIGLIWLGLSSGMVWLGIPQQAAGVIAAMAGLIGVDKIRDYAMSVTARRAEGGQ